MGMTDYSLLTHNNDKGISRAIAPDYEFARGVAAGKLKKNIYTIQFSNTL